MILGVTPPLGLFDPLQLYTSQDKSTQSRLRTAERKHARLAMLAFLGILGPELLLPTHPPALFSSFSVLGVGAAFLPGVAWEAYDTFFAPHADNKKETDSSATTALLKQEALTRILQQESPDFEAERQAKRQRVDLESKELNNGRLAMLGVVGALAQEAATGRGLLF